MKVGRDDTKVKHLDDLYPHVLMRDLFTGEQPKAGRDPVLGPNQYSTFREHEQVCGERPRAGICRRSSSHPADHIDFGSTSRIYTYVGLASEVV